MFSPILYMGFINSLPGNKYSLQSTLASYWRHCKHASSYRLLMSLWQRFPWLALVFDINTVLPGKTTNNLNVVQINPVWQPEPEQIVGYKSQIRFFQKLFPCAKLSIQRGTEWDKFQPIKPDSNVDAATDTNRLTVTSQTPLSHIKLMVCYLFVKENGYLKNGLKRRCIYQQFNPE